MKLGATMVFALVIAFLRLIHLHHCLSKNINSLLGDQ